MRKRKGCRLATKSELDATARKLEGAARGIGRNADKYARETSAREKRFVQRIT